MRTQSTDRFGRPGIYLFLYVCIALTFFLRLYTVAEDQLQAPFDLVFETPNLSTIKLIKDGKNPYSPDIYSKAPFIITLYPPLYHYIVAVFPVLEENPFFFGRAVSMVCMFLAALTLFFVNRRNRIRLLPFIAAAVFFSVHPVINNTAFLKNDPMALMYSAFAVVLIHRTASKGGAILSALLCVCALATKQSYIAAALTCAIYLLLSNRKLFTAYLLSFSIFSGFFILITFFAWGKGFWFSTVSALGQDIVSRQAFRLLRYMAGQPLVILLAVLSFSSMFVAAKKIKLTVFKGSPYFLYVLISGVILAATLGKQGASANYFFEFLLSQLMWLVYVFRNVDASDFRKPVFYVITSAFVFCSIVELQTAERSDYAFVDKKSLSGIKTYYRQMNQEINSLGIKHPKILNPFSQMHTYSITDRMYLNDAYQYSLLWKDGILDITAMLETIQNGYFDIIMLPLDQRPKKNSKGPQGVMIEEILKYYEPAGTGSGHQYFIRKK